MVVHNGKAVEEAAKRTVDPNRMWNNMSTAQHIGVGIMTILAGVGQGLARDNGPNPVGKMISEAIDRDVDSQKGSIEQGNKAIEQRRQLAQDFGQLSDKQSDQYEYMRAKGRMVVADQLEAAAAHYGSPKAMMAAKIEADAKRMEAAKIVQGLSERKQAQLNKDAELSTARASVGVAGYAAQTGRLELNEKVKEFGVATADKELARQEGHQFKMEEQAAAAAAKAAAKGKASEGEIMFPSGQLNPDGSPHHMKLMNEPTSPTADNPTGENPYSLKTVGGPAEQAKVMEKFNASTQLIKDLDDLRELYDKNPGSLNKWNSDARLKAQSLTRAVIHAHQAYGIAGFKGPVVEMMDKTILGTDDEHDVNSVLKDLAPQLNSVRDHTLDERVAMLGPNFTGKRQQLDIPDPLKNKPPESAWSKELTKLQAKAPEIPVGGGVQGKTAELMRKAQGAGSMMNGLSEDQQQFLRIAAKSINEPTTRAQTTQKLDDIVSKPEMPATFRAAAQHLLDTLNRPKVTQIED